MPDSITPVTTPIVVPASSVPPIALTVLRYGLTALGAVLVSRGLIDQGAADDIAGAALVIISTTWGAYLAWRNQTQKKAMAERLPDRIALVSE